MNWNKSILISILVLLCSAGLFADLSKFKGWTQACFDTIPEYHAGFMGNWGPMENIAHPLPSPLSVNEVSKEALYNQVKKFLILFAHKHKKDLTLCLSCPIR